MADRPGLSAVAVSSRSVRAARLRAGLPRRLLVGVLVLLAWVGLKAGVAGAPTKPGASVAVRPTDAPVAEDGFAEAFVRAFLSWDAARPEAHREAVRRFVAGGVEPGAGLVIPAAGRQSVVWTAAVGHARQGRDRALVTVAVALVGQPALRFVAVPVRRVGAGLAVDAVPALVGGPPLAAGAAKPSGEAVSDGDLAVVVERALGNFLRGARGNLAADLLPGAQVSVPPTPLVLQDVQALEWAGPGRVAATVLAREPRGPVYLLRYELSVARRDRWFVRGVNPPLFSTEGVSP